MSTALPAKSPVDKFLPRFASFFLYATKTFCNYLLLSQEYLLYYSLLLCHIMSPFLQGTVHEDVFPGQTESVRLCLVCDI